MSDLPKFRMVRSFGGGITPSTGSAYRVESVEPMSEKQAMQLLRDLDSPYQGMKYDDNPLGKSQEIPESK